ncbi:uncharacterized protein [Narcine bancroftii]|uniref:uncharacterized protein n=1 Tax=Narcine bancroftii TaxID=1343680 RepID=UPI0038321E1A
MWKEPQSGCRMCSVPPAGKATENILKESLMPLKQWASCRVPDMKGATSRMWIGPPARCRMWYSPPAGCGKSLNPDAGCAVCLLLGRCSIIYPTSCGTDTTRIWNILERRIISVVFISTFKLFSIEQKQRHIPTRKTSAESGITMAVGHGVTVALGSGVTVALGSGVTLWLVGLQRLWVVGLRRLWVVVTGGSVSWSYGGSGSWVDGGSESWGYGGSG